MELWVILGALLIYAFAGSMEWRRERQLEEQRQQEEQRQREEQERRDREPRERDEKRQRERALAAVRPIQLGRLKRELSWKGVTGYWITPPLKIEAVDDALYRVTCEFEAACSQAGVAPPQWGNRNKRAGRHLAEKTRDLRWLVVGDNVAKLVRVGGAIHGMEPAPMQSGSQGLIPTNATAHFYTVAAEVVIGQIKVMREVTL
ncbi:hypothetical protein AB0M39_12480 [Streptomyces sp. NPDC051907]|uniref:hypothetical protein n=1 Tax=Streptomyces sp. NPDC051907 TaxID=3155284 RepID=UPI00342706D4